MESHVRVRFAPSPTGYLHIGGARTALFNYLYAKHTSGQFLLRIEDTDQERSNLDFLQSQLQSLQWLGLQWDPLNPSEGQLSKDNLYHQSQNLKVYKKYANQLLQNGKAFYCFCTDQEISSKKQKAIAQGLSPHYDGTCYQYSLDEAQAKKATGQPAVIRFKVPKIQKQYHVPDLIRKDVYFPSNMIGDFVILRSDDMPVYNFCCVIDDHLMKITHVFRSEEHLSNTLKQMMLYEAFNWLLPHFVHLSFILSNDGKKLSKRLGATSCHEYQKRGFLPEALLNYLALLGWSDGTDQEIFTLEDLISRFTLDRINITPARYDEDKLKAINVHHLRNLPYKELWHRITPFLQTAHLDIKGTTQWKYQSLEVLKNYIETLADVPALYKMLMDAYFEVTEEGLEVLKWPKSHTILLAWQKNLNNFSGEIMDQEHFISTQKDIQKHCEVKGKDLFMPLRVAILGQPQGLELKKLVPLFKISSLQKRVQQAIDKLDKRS